MKRFTLKLFTASGGEQFYFAYVGVKWRLVSRTSKTPSRMNSTEQIIET